VTPRKTLAENADSALERARRLRKRARHELLAWYRRERRDLPWRRTRDPYAIWVSEVMLQQTRVETVLDYWPRFLRRFPSLTALARADVADVLACWSGLGYYRRARLLQAAAAQLVEHHQGRFPATALELEALPGFGSYTAGALASIAFGQSVEAVDGNVQRVLARLFGLRGDVSRGAGGDQVRGLARALLAKDGAAGEWTQSLMELGALVCTSAAPRCERCPWRESCRARALGLQAELPLKRARRAAQRVRLVGALARRGNSVLLELRPAEGRMADLWQLPTREAGTKSGLFPQRFCSPALQLGARLGRLRHAITHHAIELDLHAAQLAGRVRAPLRWVNEGELEKLGLTGMTRKVLRALGSP
jgi:A/G-specific adenine glycosylase